jgi:hypothetical protein
MRSVSEYWDLELRDDEAFTCVSVSDLHSIAAALGTSGSQLLFGGEFHSSAEALDFASIAGRIARRISAANTTAEAFGESIGWDTVDVLGDPGALAAFNIVGFRDICQAVDVNWIEAFLLAGRGRPTTR